MENRELPDLNNQNKQQEESVEQWQIERPDEKVTKKFIGELAAVCLVIVILVFYLLIYISARQHLFQNYAYVSAGYAIAPNDSISITKGFHVASTRGCKDCHGGNYTGKVMQDNWQGTIVAPNLTRGRGSGVSDYFDDDWIRAIKHGIGKDNKALLIMPSMDYNSLSDSDLLWMIAYLKQLPPVNNVLPKKKLTPFTYIGVAMGKFPPIAANIIDHSTGSVGEVKPDTTVTYGKYISSSCSGCHGENFKGAAGPNLTLSGDLSKWNYDNFSTAIIHGKLPTGKTLSDAMPWKSFSSMNETELKALFNYLKTLQ